MADWNLKDDLLGFGRSQLKYMLFHNSAFDDLTDYTHKKGLFFYDTDNDSLEVLHDDTDKWRSVLSIISLNDSAYSSDNALSGRVLVGTSDYGTVSGYNPVAAGFLKTDIDGILSNQRYITFEDIEPTDYTTTISAPGVNTRFATEKAIVDYVATQAVTPQDNILDWDGTKYLPFAAKKGVNPLYPYFYTDSGINSPSFSGNNLVLDGTMYASNFRAQSGSGATLRQTSISPTNISLYSGASGTTYYGTSDVLSGIYRIYSQKADGTCIPIQIGSASVFPIQNDEYITIDDFNQLFNINMTTVRLNKGTANKYLYLDGSKNITYVDAPSGGVTPVDNILDWDTNAYKPYTSKTASTFYMGATAPDAVATILNYDGIFRSTQLFEGTSRVMTTHGNWTANGSLHAVTTSSHAGFCPQLPASATGLFLRDDGTWGSIFWKRSGTTLSPFTTNDKIYVEVTGVNVAINGNSSANIGVLGSSTTSIGLQGTSSSSYGVLASSNSSRAGRFLILPSSTNTIASAVELLRQTQGTAANGIGCGIDFYNENSTGNNKLTSTIASVVKDVTAGSETASIEFWTVLSGTLTKQMELTGAGELIVANGKLTGLATYADNTAATGGGLTAGELYRTAAGNVMITY